MALYDIFKLTLFQRVLVFLLGDLKWQHQNAKSSHWNAQNVKKETIPPKKTLLLMLKELKSISIAQDVINAQSIKKQSNFFGGCYV